MDMPLQLLLIVALVYSVVVVPVVAVLYVPLGVFQT